jgi:hypothetical protein
MSRRQPNGHRHATLYDFRDVEIMMKLEDEADAEGWIETEHLARALGFSDDDFRNVGIRLGWMKRYGMLARDEKTGVWRLTDGGRRVIEAKLRAATTRELQTINDEALIEAMTNVLHRYRHADAMTATILRREFAYGTQPR